MRIMGIDYGDSRIGIALSDPLGWIAQGLETITWKDSIAKPIDRICKLAEQNNVDKIIVGFPKNMNGTIGIRAEKTEEFIQRLAGRVQVDIMKWDERLTTVAATRTMHETGVKTAKKKQIVDQIAAVYILQGYLDSIR